MESSKIINYYEARGEEFLDPLPGGLTHFAKMYVEANIDGKNQRIHTGIEAWGSSKKDAEKKALETFKSWAENNGFVFKER